MCLQTQQEATQRTLQERESRIGALEQLLSQQGVPLPAETADEWPEDETEGAAAAVRALSEVLCGHRWARGVAPDSGRR